MEARVVRLLQQDHFMAASCQQRRDGATAWAAADHQHVAVFVGRRCWFRHCTFPHGESGKRTQHAGRRPAARLFCALPFTHAFHAQSTPTRRGRILRWPLAGAGGRRRRQDPRDRREDRAPDRGRFGARAQDRRDHLYQQGRARDARARRTPDQGRRRECVERLHLPRAGSEVPADRTHARRLATRLLGAGCR